jgi:hypothetical protein
MDTSITVPVVQYLLGKPTRIRPENLSATGLVEVARGLLEGIKPHLKHLAKATIQDLIQDRLGDDIAFRDPDFTITSDPSPIDWKTQRILWLKDWNTSEAAGKPYFKQTKYLITDRGGILKMEYYVMQEGQNPLIKARTVCMNVVEDAELATFLAKVPRRIETLTQTLIAVLGDVIARKERDLDALRITSENLIGCYGRFDPTMR